MEVLLDSGINFIIYFQKSWAGWKSEMLFLSKVGDPRNSFLIYFPVVYHLNHNLGVSLLWTAIFSEWINLVLKWILRGDRPYWWIHETARWKNVTLQQFELTCETGPGSPSGHSMVTSAVLCLVFLWLMNSLKGNLCQAHFLNRFIITTTIWSILLTILSLVSLSRVFIATHFPHQVILGTIIGLFVAFTVRRNSSELFKFSHSVLHCTICSIMLVVMTLVSHFILSVLIYDPSISVTKAQKWCVNPSYVHLDTTPFYALVRDSGATLGLGIAFLIVRSVTRAGMNNYWRALCNVQIPLLSKSSRIILSVFLLQLLEAISLPKSNPLLFYLAGYARCAFIPIIVIFVVPMIILS